MQECNYIFSTNDNLEPINPYTFMSTHPVVLQSLQYGGVSLLVEDTHGAQQLPDLNLE